MPDDRVSRVTLQYVVDQQKLDDLERSISDVKTKLLDLTSVSTAAGVSIAEAGQRIETSFSSSDLDVINQMRAGMGDLADQAERVGRVPSGGGIDLSSLARGAGRAANQIIPGSGRGLQLFGDLGLISKDVGQVGDALGVADAGAVELVGSLGLVVAAVEAVIIVENQFAKQFDGLQDAFDVGLNAFDKFYAGIGKVTTEQAKQNIADAQEQLKNDQQKLTDAQKQYNRDRNGPVNSQVAETVQLAGTLQGGLPGLLGAAVTNPQALAQQITSALGSATPILGKPLGELEKDLESAKKAVDDDNASIQANTELIKQGKTASADAADFYGNVLPGLLKSGVAVGDTGVKAIADYQRQSYADQVKDAQDNAKTQLAINKEISADTYDQAKLRLEAISQEQVSNLQLIESLKAIKDPTGAAAVEVAKLTEANKGLVNEGTQLLANLDNLPAELDARNKRLEDIQQKYDDATLAAEDKAAQDRAAISKKLADTLVSDAQKYSDALAQDLTALTQKQADLTTGLNRDLTAEQVDQNGKTLTIQIDAQRKAVDLARDHTATMLQIQKDGDEKETQDLLDRNFLGLLKDRLSTASDLNKENASFNSKTAQEQRDETRQLADLERSIQQQRTERLLAYNNANADAQTQYARADAAALAAQKLADSRAEAARKQADAELTRNLKAQATARRNAEIDELNIANKYGPLRVAAEEKTQKALLKAAQDTLNSLATGISGGSEMAHRAGGGPVSGGTPYIVNDAYPGQRETFNGIPLPSNALGMFIPLQSGNIGKGGGGNVYNFSIISHDPQGVRAEVLDMLEGTIA